MSGRPDPSWPLPGEARARLVASWDALPPSRGGPPRPPPLGYRGCVVAGGADRWFAYAGVVQRTRGGAVEAREDRARGVERALIDTAPDDALRRMLIDIARGGSRW
jgi:hypothetical protein